MGFPPIFWLLRITLLWTSTYKMRVDVCFHFSWSRSAESCSNSMWHGGCPIFILHSHQQWRRVPALFIVYFCFLILNVIILVGVKLYLTVISVCVALMVNNVEHLLLCLLAIYLHVFFEELTVHFPAHFLSGCLSFLLSESCDSSLYSGCKSFIRFMTCKNFLPFWKLTSASLMVSFETQSF